MARFYGEVGYGDTVEDPPGSGVWIDVMTEQVYLGDVVRNSRKLEPGSGLNDNITIGNSISIVADDYAIKHFSKIKYVRWMGALWEVSSIDNQSPRLVLSLGSVYNGPTP